MGLTAKFGPAFSVDQQRSILDHVSKSLIQTGISVHSFKEALLVPEAPSSVDIRCSSKGSVVLELDSSEHVRFVRGVMNDKTERSRLTFAIPTPAGYPHGFVAKPTGW